jgi:hypothetical protein
MKDGSTPKREGMKVDSSAKWIEKTIVIDIIKRGWLD